MALMILNQPVVYICGYKYNCKYIYPSMPPRSSLAMRHSSPLHIIITFSLGKAPRFIVLSSRYKLHEPCQELPQLPTQRPALLPHKAVHLARRLILSQVFPKRRLLRQCFCSSINFLQKTSISICQICSFNSLVAVFIHAVATTSNLGSNDNPALLLVDASTVDQYV